jgi:CelD/BcsL family acetyltransferase involved in cellulose biosynthesis
LRLVVKREIPEDEKLARHWNTLAERLERPEVFYTYEWALAVQRAYGSRFTPLLMLGYEGDTLSAVASLALDREQSNQVVFLAATTADYCDFLSPAEQRDTWVATVFRELQRLRFTKVILSNLPSGSRSVPAIEKAARTCGYHRYARSGYHCAQVLLPDSKERETLRRSVLSKKMLQRNLRAMAKVGPTEFSTEKEWKEIEPALSQFNTAHVARFLDTSRISNLARPERRQFLHELANLLSGKGWFAFSRLKLAEKSIAWNYGFQYAGSWFWYQPTFNSHYADFSPGYCLLGKIVEGACQLPGIARVDLGLGEEGYKDRFANSTCETLHVSLSNSYAEHLRTVGRHRLASIIKRSQPAERFVRSAVGRIAALRKHLKEKPLLSVLGWLAWRGWHSLFGTDEVLFFAAEIPQRVPCDIAADGRIERISLELLATAAMQYFGDEETLNYLVRGAQRLRRPGAEGFALMREGIPVHFAWSAGFEGFYMAELGQHLRAPANDAKLVFDCWTPVSMRGRGYYAQTLALLSGSLRREDHAAWIFGAATNHPTLRGIRKAGFEYRFTLRRRRVLGISRVVTVGCITPIASERSHSEAIAAGQI